MQLIVIFCADIFKVLLDRKVNGTILWNAIFAAVPPDLILDEEIVASLLEHKDLLLQCLERAGNRILSSGKYMHIYINASYIANRTWDWYRAVFFIVFLAWKAKLVIAKIMEEMENDDEDDDDDDDESN